MSASHLSARTWLCVVDEWSGLRIAFPNQVPVIRREILELVHSPRGPFHLNQRDPIVAAQSEEPPESLMARLTSWVTACRSSVVIA